MKKLFIIGMNPRTLGGVPWDADAEIWTLNEAPTSGQIKRWDVLFQLHKRWDWERNNNFNDPNHPLFIKGISGACIACAGSGKLTINGAQVDCLHCNAGNYELPAHRAGKSVVMQDFNRDVAGCVRLPIEDLTAQYCGGIPYFTSTFAHMLVFAFHVKHTEIVLYGWGMESQTEYAHQRPCAEYWVGWGRARGFSIVAPGAPILKGDHYAYESMQQGYRTRLEMRKAALIEQLQGAQAAAALSEGALSALVPFKAMPEILPAFNERFDDHYRKKNFVSFLNGAIRETQNLIDLLDAFYAGGSEKPNDAAKLLGLTYQLS